MGPIGQCTVEWTWFMDLWTEEGTEGGSPCTECTGTFNPVGARVATRADVATGGR